MCKALGKQGELSKETVFHGWTNLELSLQPASPNNFSVSVPAP